MERERAVILERESLDPFAECDFTGYNKLDVLFCEGVVGGAFPFKFSPHPVVIPVGESYRFPPEGTAPIGIETVLGKDRITLFVSGRVLYSVYELTRGSKNFVVSRDPARLVKKTIAAATRNLLSGAKTMPSLPRSLQTGRFLLALACCSTVATGVPAADSLEKAMVQQAPGILKTLQKNGYQNVGVLKFLVSKDGKAYSDNVGTLNLLLARRLEVALILANNPREPMGVLRNPSAVAARTAGAGHLTKAGREKLFSVSYPLAWGDKTVDADAFVTGSASIAADLKTVTISLFVFDRKENKLTPLGEDFKVATDPAKLAEMGESFVLRGAFDDGVVDTGTPAENPEARAQFATTTAAVRVRTKEAKFPLSDPAAPLGLDVYYDGACSCCPTNRTSLGN